jgi:hypothetical protein
MTIRERLPSYLPIALGYSGHNLLIGVADSNVGQIAFSCDYPNRMAGVHSVAASLGTFLAMLTSQPPEWVRLLRARDAAGVVRWLDLGGDPDAYSGYIGGALEYASRTQQWDVAAALIARGARLPDDREQLLEYDAPEWFRKVVHAL